MRLTQPYAIILIGICLVLACGPGFARSIEDRKWIRMESPNFTVHSMVDKRKTKELLLHLEATFAAFPSLSERSDALIRTRIFVLKGDRDMQELGLDTDRYAGMFIPGLRRNAMIIRYSKFQESGEVAIHEFVHFLLMNLVRFPFPKWYHEGYAEYVASSHLSRTTFYFGAPSRGWLYSLDRYEWLPMKAVIDAEQMPRDETIGELRKFYAQSWLLVHYLQSRPQGPRLTLQNLQTYAKYRHAGASETEAFEQGFGIGVEDLEATLKSYMHKGRYRGAELSIEELREKFEPVVTKLSKEQVSIALADLLIRLSPGGGSAWKLQQSEARDLLDVAMGDESMRARAEILSGMLSARLGDIESAEVSLLSGVAAMGDDSDAILDAANFYLTSQARNIETAGAYLETARRINAEIPEFAFLYGNFLIGKGKFEEAIPWLTEASMAAPAHHATWINLAIAHAGIGDNENARAYAREVLLFPHLSGQAREFAREMIERLETD